MTLVRDLFYASDAPGVGDLPAELQDYIWSGISDYVRKAMKADGAIWAEGPGLLRRHGDYSYLLFPCYRERP